MTETEIHKALLKQNPSAELIHIKSTGIKYRSAIMDGDEKRLLFFEVPLSDMGTAAFHGEMEAKHLKRWLVKHCN